MSLVGEGMFVAFRTGAIERWEYGSEAYFGMHPQLSLPLIERLLEKKTAIIGVDCSGVRRGAEHTKTDQYCADRGTFIVENLTALDGLLASSPSTFTVYTFPVRFLGLTGLPCRVVAELA